VKNLGRTQQDIDTSQSTPPKDLQESWQGWEPFVEFLETIGPLDVQPYVRGDVCVIGGGGCMPESALLTDPQTHTLEPTVTSVVSIDTEEPSLIGIEPQRLPLESSPRFTQGTVSYYCATTHTLEEMGNLPHGFQTVLMCRIPNLDLQLDNSNLKEQLSRMIQPGGHLIITGGVEVPEILTSLPGFECLHHEPDLSRHGNYLFTRNHAGAVLKRRLSQEDPTIAHQPSESQACSLHLAP